MPPSKRHERAGLIGAARAVADGARTWANVQHFRLTLAQATRAQRAGHPTAMALSISKREVRSVRAETSPDCRIFGARIHKSRGAPVRLAEPIAAELSARLATYRAAGGRVFVKGYADRQWGLSLAALPSDAGPGEPPTLSRIETSIFGPRPSDRQSDLFAYISDARGIYFDGRVRTDFEALLDEWPKGSWANDPVTARFIHAAANKQVQKYPEFDQAWSDAVSPDSVLIVGQVSGDAATLETDSLTRSNYALAAFARQTFPERDLYYKGHPREAGSDEARRIIDAFGCLPVPPTAAFTPLCQKFKTMITATSGAGLEAALLGMHVHTTGVSFYSHRGFTTDHHPLDPSRRENDLTPQDVFAAFVAAYAHPATGDAASAQRITFAQFLDELGWT